MNTQSIFKIMTAGLIGMTSVNLTAEGSWTRKADMPTARFGLTSSVVNGKIYAIGGATGPGADVRTVEEYDPATDSWTKKANMLTAVSWYSASVINDKIYAIGGGITGVRSIYSESNYYLKDFEEFTPPPSNITPKPNLFITFPKDNAKITSSINISGTASAYLGKIKSVQIKIDANQWNITNGTDKWSFNFNTENLSDGNYTISVRCYDGLRFSDIKMINVTVQDIQKFDKKNDTPGFECIFTICAIILILLYKRKKNRLI